MENCLLVVGSVLVALCVGGTLWYVITEQIAAKVAEKERSILLKGAVIGAAGCIGAEMVSNLLFAKNPAPSDVMTQAQRMAEMFQHLRQQYHHQQQWQQRRQSDQ